MWLDNRLALLLLAVLLGAVANIGLIGGQAYLLSQTNPVYFTVVAVAAVIFFAVSLRFSHYIRTKFARSFAGITMLYAVALACLLLPVWTDLQRSIGWSFLAVLGVNYFWNALLELSVRYLDPTRSKVYFFYIATAFEGGILIASLLMHQWSFSPLYILGFSAAGALLSASLMIKQFFPIRNLEIQFSVEPEKPTEQEENYFKPILKGVIGMSICLVGVKTCSEYLISVVLKENLQSFEAISEMIARYFLIMSSLSMVFSVMMGRWLSNYHSSPFYFFAAQWLCLVLAALVCVWNPVLIAFIGFEVVRKVTSHALYRPANQMVFSGFVTAFRNRMRAIDNMAGMLFAGIPLAALFYWTQHWPYLEKRSFLLGMILIFFVINAVVLWRYRQQLIKVWYQLAFFLQVASASLAVQMLAFFRPKDFIERMEQLLRSNPQAALRKTVILGLGFAEQARAVELIIDEFNHEQEEIQLSVLEALKRAKSYKARQFLINIVTSKITPKSFRVRLNATVIVASLLGKKAIPFLLNDLEDPDPRVVANTLETLSLYKDRHLIPYFKKHLNSDAPRVRVNALFALADFKETKALYRNTVDSIFTENNKAMMNALVYVIGKLRDKHYHDRLRQLYMSHAELPSHLKIMLAWALTQLDDTEGYKLMGQLLVVSELPVHFFAQLKQEKRFQVLHHLAVEDTLEVKSLCAIQSNLRESLFDFNLELEYLRLLIQQIQ